MARIKVEFINLRQAGAELGPACARLAAFHYASGRRVLMVAADQNQAADLDRLLWTFDPASFIPHAQAGGPDQDQEPVLIALSPQNLNRAQVLILAAPMEEPPLADFDWVILFVPVKEGPELARSREIYRRLKQDGAVELSHSTRLP